MIYRSGQTITGDATFNIYNIKNYGKNNSADDDDEDQEDKRNKVCVYVCVCVCGNVFRDIFAIDFQLLNLPYLLCKVQVPYASRNVFKNLTFVLLQTLKHITTP